MAEIKYIHYNHEKHEKYEKTGDGSAVGEAATFSKFFNNFMFMVKKACIGQFLIKQNSFRMGVYFEAAGAGAADYGQEIFFGQA